MRTGRLLFWGMIRFVLALLVVSVLTVLILAYHKEMMELIWIKPESPWIVWLWYLASWVISLLLMLIATFVAFLLSQVLFSAVIMDHMSRITESMVRGRVREPATTSPFHILLYLTKQEIPRVFIPVSVSLFVMILSWITPFGPPLAGASSVLAVVSLAWDNTDLVPARRFVPFRERWQLLKKNFFFHLGFGLPFLIPILNIVFLSFAPIGATLYYLEKHDAFRNPER